MSEEIPTLIPAEDADTARDRVVEVLRDGGMAVIPTDSGYAIVADAFNQPATRKVFAVKRQRRQAPLSVLIRSPRQVGGLAAEIPEAAERLMASYWPGPLTLIFRAQEGLTWYLGESEGAVALRMPTDDLTLSIVAEIGPLAATLASKLGMPLPSTGQEAQGLLRRAVQVYVEGGRREQEPSTIVDVTREGAVILRRGAIPAAHVEQVASGAVGWGQRPGDAGPAAETDAEAAADDLMQERARTARPEAETEVADADRDRG